VQCVTLAYRNRVEGREGPDAEGTVSADSAVATQ